MRRQWYTGSMRLHALYDTRAVTRLYERAGLTLGRTGGRNDEERGASFSASQRGRVAWCDWSPALPSADRQIPVTICGAERVPRGPCRRIRTPSPVDEHHAPRLVP